MTTTNKSEGAEWEADYDALFEREHNGVWLHLGAAIHQPQKDVIRAFIAHQRQQAYAEGYKQGTFDKEAELELGVVRGQAVAEFAREVLAKQEEWYDDNLGHLEGAQYVTVDAIRTIAKERGIELN